MDLFSRLWFDNFLQTVVSDQDTITWFGCKSEKGEPLLLWPLWQQPNKTLHPTRITSLANYYTTLYEPLHTISDELLLEKIIMILAKKICQLHWDYIDFYPLNPKSPIFTLLIQAFQQQNKYIQPYFMYGNWFLLTNNKNYATYYSSLPSRLKNTLERRSNKLKKEHSIEFKICTNFSETEATLRHYQSIYSQSWKKTEPYQNFVPNLVKQSAKKGWLRMGQLIIDNEVAAIQVWFTLHNTAYIYKMCHLSKYSKYSIGSLLTEYLIKTAINQDKVLKIDFLTGDDNYKKDWMNERKELWGIQLTNKHSFYGILRIVKHVIKKNIQLS